MSNDPYEVLNLDRDADKATIRAHYLKLVREFSPERAPERFAEIRAAYDQLNDPVALVTELLFEAKSSKTFDSLAAGHKTRLREERLPTRILMSLAKR